MVSILSQPQWVNMTDNFTYLYLIIMYIISHLFISTHRKKVVKKHMALHQICAWRPALVKCNLMRYISFALFLIKLLYKKGILAHYNLFIKGDIHFYSDPMDTNTHKIIWKSFGFVKCTASIFLIYQNMNIKQFIIVSNDLWNIIKF